MATRMQQRRGTAAQWTAANPILAAGEIGFETDTSKFKMGNGSSTWSALTYFANAAELAAIIDGAPDLLNTLNELAASIGDDPNFLTALATNARVDGVVLNGQTQLTQASNFFNDALVAHTADTTNVHGIVNTELLATKLYADGKAAEISAIAKSEAITAANEAADQKIVTAINAIPAITSATLGLGEVDNTQDAFKPVSAAQADAIATAKTEAITTAGIAADAKVSAHDTDTTNVHGIANTALLVTQTDLSNAITGVTVDQSTLAGTGIDWNPVSEAFDVDSTFVTNITTTAIDALTTSVIEEGSNLYFTATRAQDEAKSVISAGDNAIVTDSLEVSTVDFNVGSAAKGLRTTDEYTNPIAVFSTAATDYAQVAVKNTTDAPDSSTDLIVYASNGSDTSGYMDMGITAPSFADPQFTITGGNDGYIFMEAPEGTLGDGNLVLATGANGAHNHIVFAAGGLQSNNTQMIIRPDDTVHIEIDTPSTSPTTGALTVTGGVGIQGDMNIQGDVNIEGTIVFGGQGTTVATSNLSVTDPLVFTGASNAADIVDLGIVGEYKVGANTKYAGIVRDASDGIIKAFKGASTKPSSSVNFAEAGLGYSDMQVAGLTASSATIGNVSNTELQYLDGVTSAIQTQIDAKAPVNSPTFTGTVTLPSSGIVFSDGTQVKAGVPSITAFATAISSSATLAAGEADKFVPLTGAVTITLPASGYSTGQSIDFWQSSGTGAAFASTNGVVGTPGLKFRTTNSVATAMKISSGWLVFGDLSA